MISKYAIPIILFITVIGLIMICSLHPIFNRVPLPIVSDVELSIDKQCSKTDQYTYDNTMWFKCHNRLKNLTSK